jgi:hypothetical protein
MSTLTEARHTAEFILSEANGSRSREAGTLASGQDLEAGTVVMFSGANLVEYAVATANSVAGILLAATDASAGAVAVTYIARDAEVNLNLLTYPQNTDESDDEATIAGLADIGIIARD